MRDVVVISGRLCNGKSKLAALLRKDFGYLRIKTSRFLVNEAKKRKISPTRHNLQKLGDTLDKETRFQWVRDLILRVEKTSSGANPIVVDSLRNWMQLQTIRKERTWRVIHIHLYAPKKELLVRFEKKKEKRKEGKVTIKYEKADFLKNNRDVTRFKEDADVRINTARTDAGDTLVRVAARLGLFSPPNFKCVDVIVGGQYGSEGKGHVAAYLSKEYDVLVRVGGPNAGHTVSSGTGVYTYHHLPSGCRDTQSEILLGPGATIFVPKLLKEISECEIESSRLFIDSQAMIIEEHDIEKEASLKDEIGSTQSGSGAAAARKILGRRAKPVSLAKNIPELREFVGKNRPYRGSTFLRLEQAYRERKSVLLEGTQGSGLSIHHGDYPYVTSRDTNVAGCLAEAGISPNRVRRILMVIRPTPIRVGDPDHEKGYSGDLKHDTSLEEIALLAGLDSKDVIKAEKTSTTRRNRKVGWFDWEQFRKACALNAPTDIVLTFADYLDAENQKARRFEQLKEDTIKFVEEIERVAHVPVSLINTRFPRKDSERMDLRTVIDRRNW